MERETHNNNGDTRSHESVRLSQVIPVIKIASSVNDAVDAVFDEAEKIRNIVRNLGSSKLDAKQSARKKIENPETLEDVMHELVDTIHTCPYDTFEPQRDEIMDIAISLEELLTKKAYLDAVTIHLKDIFRAKKEPHPAISQLYHAFAFWCPVLSQLIQNLNKNITLIDQEGTLLWKFIGRILHKLSKFLEQTAMETGNMRKEMKTILEKVREES